MVNLGWSAFARRYSQNRYYFLFLRVLRYFNSPGFTSPKGYLFRWVSPFGYLWIIAYLQLPTAFRC